jgi:hypothetical protein
LLDAIGQSLPLALVVALSPVPITVVIVLLTTSRATANGIAFAGGWFVGLAVVGAILLVIEAQAPESESGHPATWVSVLKVVAGALLVLAGGWQFWRGRGRETSPALPNWMGRLEGLSPARGFLAGTGLAGVSPKNILLILGGLSVINATGIRPRDQALAFAVFAVVGTIGVAIPVAISVVLKDRASTVLAKLREWMTEKQFLIMAILSSGIGVKLIADGVNALAA